MINDEIAKQWTLLTTTEQEQLIFSRPPAGFEPPTSVAYLYQLENNSNLFEEK